ncbi:hypothetical protein MM213_09900 [Belliella sp. R4-6]|uniref:Uncharacterized protein n=1 Tax=Belliella alkalica TaxID=1730871 RepID=A0ABS9VBI1_9BACT|nr:hypothetical protein [Belliella alkalica]MCH7413797.1 hypothetical protein [Belliella alkalica]
MIKKSSISENEQAVDVQTETNREFSIFSKIFKFVIRLYIKILKYTIVAFIEIFKEILRIPFGKKSKKHRKNSHTKL